MRPSLVLLSSILSLLLVALGDYFRFGVMPSVFVLMVLYVVATTFEELARNLRRSA